MTFRITYWNLKEEALDRPGKCAVEEAVDLSQDRLRNEPSCHLQFYIELIFFITLASFEGAVINSEFVRVGNTELGDCGLQGSWLD